MPPITVDLLIQLHNGMLQDFPATAGFKNKFAREILEKTIGSYYYTSCFVKAAFVCYKIVADKPFNSLNKRMAMSIISLYLNQAGFEFTASSLEALQFVNDIETGLPLDKIEAFIRENSTPL